MGRTAIAQRSRCGSSTPSREVVDSHNGGGESRSWLEGEDVERLAVCLPYLRTIEHVRSQHLELRYFRLDS